MQGKYVDLKEFGGHQVPYEHLLEFGRSEDWTLVYRFLGGCASLVNYTASDHHNCVAKYDICLQKQK